ncbi:MAG: hypothetical protein KDB14_18755, partial [Planctomycetales bacterium]|nr:hypothetical protein [Planctomycetales bacterium]
MSEDSLDLGSTAFNLRALTHPLGLDEFFANHWPTKLFVGQGDMNRFRALLQIPELGSIESLLSVASGPIRLWPPHQNNHEGTLVEPPEQALRLYRAGWTIYFNQVEQSVPALLPLIRRLEADLGLHTGHVATEVFASHASAGARPHCDFDFGFNVQIRGQKTWRLCPNRNFSNPHTSVIIETPFNPEVAAYSQGELPRAMPTEDGIEVVAEPGTVVFIPRGMWHTTVATEPSFALTFACKGTMWSQYLTQEFQQRLQRFAPWREFPDRWVGENGVAKAAREKKLAVLIEGLKEVVEELSANQLIKTWSQPRADLYEVAVEKKPEVLAGPIDGHPGPFVSL